MTEPSLQSQLEALHGAWCRASSQELNFKATERLFYELHKLDFTPSDVTVAVEHLMRFNKRSDGAKFAIRANKVLEPETFSCLVAEARAVLRNRRPAPTEREKVADLRERVIDKDQASTLNQTHPHSFGEVLKRMGQG